MESWSFFHDDWLMNRKQKASVHIDNSFSRSLVVLVKDVAFVRHRFSNRHHRKTSRFSLTFAQGKRPSKCLFSANNWTGTENRRRRISMSFMAIRFRSRTFWTSFIQFSLSFIRPSNWYASFRRRNMFSAVTIDVDKFRLPAVCSIKIDSKMVSTWRYSASENLLKVAELEQRCSSKSFVGQLSLASITFIFTSMSQTLRPSLFTTRSDFRSFRKFLFTTNFRRKNRRTATEWFFPLFEVEIDIFRDFFSSFKQKQNRNKFVVFFSFLDSRRSQIEIQMIRS